MRRKYNLDDIFRLVFVTSFVLFLVSLSFTIYKDNNSLHGILFASWFVSVVTFLLLLIRKRRSNTTFINPSKPSAEYGLAFLLSTNDEMEVQVIKGLLASNGIEAIIKHAVAGSFGTGLDAYTHAYLGQSSLGGLVVLNIYVKVDDFKKAKHIIEKYSNKG